MTAGPHLAHLAQVLGGLVVADQPLGPLTTYRVGGPAALFATITTEADLCRVRDALAEHPVPVLVVGRGSNLLVADAGFPGLALRLAGELATLRRQPEAIEGPGADECLAADEGPVAIEGPGAGEGPGGDAPTGPVAGARPVLRAGAGMDLPVVARRSVEAGLTGFEWAVGVPGSIGGAVAMNAGGHGSDMAAVLCRYRWLPLVPGAAARTDGPERLAYGYRASSVRATDVVLWAELALAPGSREEGRATLREIVRWRRANQPGGSNAGSVFTNPPGDSAGRLVEAAGLKGFRLGSAAVSGKHANFIQADEGGSAADVYRLMEHVRAAVRRHAGVNLRAEVRLVGFGDRPGAGEAP